MTIEITNETESPRVDRAIDLAFGGTINFSAIGGSPLDQYPDGVKAAVAALAVRFQDLAGQIERATDQDARFGILGGDGRQSGRDAVGLVRGQAGRTGGRRGVRCGQGRGLTGN